MTAESPNLGSKKDCVFCKIAVKEQESRIIYEDEKTVVFPDIRPAANHHYLVIPKEHMEIRSHSLQLTCKLLNICLRLGRMLLPTVLLILRTSCMATTGHHLILYSICISM